MNKQDWVSKQNKNLRGNRKKSIKPKRRYPHFDTKIRKISPDISKKIFDENYISRHGFYPFIQYTKTTRRRIKGKQFAGYEKKPRKISYSCHLDSLIYSWYSYQLECLYEKELSRRSLSSNVLAYRSGNGSPPDHACTAFREAQNMGNAHILCADIIRFFDNLSHDEIKKTWLKLLQTEKPELEKLPVDHYKVYRSVTKYSYVEMKKIYDALGMTEREFYKSPPSRLFSAKEFRNKVADIKAIVEHTEEKGIPQGSCISALIANMYMLDFDTSMRDSIESLGGKYYRYSDDIFIAIPKANAEIQAIESLLLDEIERLKLSINKEKNETYVLTLENGGTIRDKKTGNKKNLNYLGMSFDGRRVLFKHGSLAKYQRKAMRAARSALRYHFREKMPVPKKSLTRRFTKLGKQNFQSYVKRTASIIKEHGFSPSSALKQASDFFVHKALRNPQIIEETKAQVERRESVKKLRRDRLLSSS